MDRHATLYTRGGKQYFVARLEVDNDEDPAELALWIGQCLQEGRLLEIEEGLVLERTTGNRWRVSLRPEGDPGPPSLPGATPPGGTREPEPEAIEPEEPAGEIPEPELQPDPVLARALGLASAQSAAPTPTGPPETPEERRERLLNQHSPLPRGRDASARENEARTLRFLQFGPNTTDRVALGIGLTREGARRILNRLVEAGQLQRTEVASGYKNRGVASTVVYYHRPGQTPPTMDEPHHQPSSTEKIIAVLTTGPKTVGELCDATGHSSHTIRHRLKRLLGERKVREMNRSGLPRWTLP